MKLPRDNHGQRQRAGAHNKVHMVLGYPAEMSRQQTGIQDRAQEHRE